MLNIPTNGGLFMLIYISELLDEPHDVGITTRIIANGKIPCCNGSGFRFLYLLPNIIPKGINMILYLTLILKYWQYIVIVLCSIVIVALLIRCNILDERNTSLKKENNNK